jgi:hypothetical protein
VRASFLPAVHRRVVAAQMPLMHSPAHIPLEQGEQRDRLHVAVPAKCEAVTVEGAAEDPGVLQVRGEGGPLMNRR